ncbi:CRISPR-associated DxTHG motif protein [Moraxella catarrhalis]|nr:CRISPR-associated DxTHG motif protein [Moraxella catarrhalis]MPW58746.1 CRISPR-associated DxTHG motif protein [Moraxella catarrhalis]MPW62452.1 CRISPR-associated DxTHG motif protein [Moraxella catarrhalis]MPW64056.1 CRISPR-associated DxTHG motif protein [Moraxella catarrhalis]MPW66902.1 CRISPR-associated DxTHG motif protein [Moraxella catarrhalis]
MHKNLTHGFNSLKVIKMVV